MTTEKQQRCEGEGEKKAETSVVVVVVRDDEMGSDKEWCKAVNKKKQEEMENKCGNYT